MGGPAEMKSATTAQQRQTLQNWCSNTWPQLYRFVYHRVQNREEAEDLLQETYLRVLPSISLAEGLPLERLPSYSYLQTVALNLIRDRWRRQKARGTQVPFDEALLLSDPGAQDGVEQAWMQGPASSNCQPPAPLNRRPTALLGRPAEVPWRCSGTACAAPKWG